MMSIFAKTKTSFRQCSVFGLVITLLTAAAITEAQSSRSTTYFNRGINRYHAGDLDGAIADFNAALTAEPRLAVAYNMRGSARYRKGDVDGSLADYSRAIEIEPHFAMAYYNRGKV